MSGKFKPIPADGPLVLNRKLADEIIARLDEIKSAMPGDVVLGSILLAMMADRNKDGNTKTEVALIWHKEQS